MSKKLSRHQIELEIKQIDLDMERLEYKIESLELELEFNKRQFLLEMEQLRQERKRRVKRLGC